MKKLLKIVLPVIFLLPLFVSAQSSFFVERSYDYYGRKEVDVFQQKNTNKINFYVETDYWNKMSSDEKRIADDNLYNLSVEFENSIYPRLTGVFGSEPRVGEKLTVLFHHMPLTAGGYFRSGDQYSALQYSQSNERNILYLNIRQIASMETLKANLAHEFVHLINFNQKDRIRGVSEETWLNELRAEWAVLYLGYNDYLNSRIQSFLRDSSTSLTEWTNKPGDYGVAILLAQYIEDHYGRDALVKSMFSDKVGIASLEEQGINFNNVFTDWTIAVYLNDCSINPRYCYKHPQLVNLRVVPQNTILPNTEQSSMTVNYSTKNWAGNWYRISGGKGNLEFIFKNNNLNFRIPYILCDYNQKCSVNFLDERIALSEFNTKWSSLVIIPSLQEKKKDFNGLEPSYGFSWSANISQKPVDADLRAQLLAEIQRLQAEVQRLQNLLASRGSVCTISNNLNFGLRDSNEVRCLQQKLYRAGFYPSGLITGNFLFLTQQAVINFQESRASEILEPVNLSRGNGFVGPLTRQALLGL